MYVPPLDNDFGTILHEFGHTLGLRRDDAQPLERVRTKVGSAKLVENQMLEAVEEGSIMNISTFDQDSIMM